MNKCIGCEGIPVAPNSPCAVCGLCAAPAPASPAALTGWDFTKRDTGDWIVSSPTGRRWVAYADSNSAELVDALLAAQPADDAHQDLLMKLDDAKRAAHFWKTQYQTLANAAEDARAARQQGALSEDFESAFKLIFEAYGAPGDRFISDTQWLYFVRERVTKAFSLLQKVRASSPRVEAQAVPETLVAQQCSLSDAEILAIAKAECQPFPWGIGTTKGIFLQAVRAILSRASSPRAEAQAVPEKKE